MYASGCIDRPLIEFAPDGFKLKAKYSSTFTKKNGEEQKTTNTIVAEFNKEWKVEKFTPKFNPPLAEIKVTESDLDAKGADN